MQRKSVRRAAASTGPVLVRRRPRLDRLAVAVALAAPGLLLVVDQLLHVLLTAS